MNKTFIAQVAQAIFTNEIGNNERLKYCFSDADGERTGKSGYSFGGCQFDIENNWTAIDCLRDCGFRPKDLDRLFEQTSDISDLNTLLRKNRETVDRYDEHQIREEVEYCSSLLNRSNVILFDNETLAHVVDYHNQFYLSKQGKLHRHLISLNRVIMPKDILEFKLTTKWGKKRPDDVKRRFETVRDICG